jgi:lysophospholipase L1-like esterase
LPASLDPLATVPLPLDVPANTVWSERNQENVQRLLLGGHANVLFLGDSITDWLRTGAGEPVWDAFLGPLDAENLAIAGLTTSQVLWQVETGQVALASPDVVVLMIGTNNLALLEQSPRAVAAGITQIVTALEEQLPQTRILLVGILPRGQTPDDPLRAAVAEVNRLIAGLDDGGRVTFLDVGGWFLQPDGQISPKVMPDFLHPSLLGYQIYTAAIWLPLIELLPQE